MTHRSSPALPMCSVSFAVLLLTAAAAHAQSSGTASADADAKATPSASDGSTLAPTTVTDSFAPTRGADDIVERVSRGSALFGDSDLRTVPLTVNVVTDVEIANRQAKTIGQALLGDPAVLNDYGASGAYPTESFNIRGFQIAGGNAFLKDGMPMAGQVTQGTENIEQIEVVRGPVGFRYGYLPPGGAINMVSKRPTATPLRSFTLSTDSYGSAKGHLDLGGRFGEQQQFGYRINAVAEDAKLFFKPTERHRTLLALALDWRLNADNTLSLSYDRNHFKAGPDLFHYTVPDSTGREIKGIPPKNYFGQKFLPDNDFRVQTGSLGWDSRITPNLTLSTRFSLYENDARYYITTYSNAQPNGDFNVSVNKSHNLALTKANTTYLNWRTAGALPQSITAGFSWQQENFRRRTSGGGLLVDPFTRRPVVNNFFFPRQFFDTTPGISGSFQPFLNRRQAAVFISDEIKLADRWRALVALRSGYMRDASANRTQPGRTSSTDPTLGLMFDVTPQVMLYGSYATGLENGGTAPATARNAFAQMGPMKSKQIEIGAKTDFDGGNLTLDGSVFRIQKAAEFVNASNVYVQDGRQTHTGAEVRLIGKVHPLLTVSTGLQWLHGRFTGSPTTEGSRPMNVPRLHATFTGDLKVPAVPGLTLTGGLYYTGEREINVPNIAAKAPAYTRLDLGLRYETRIDGHDVIGRFSVENVTNRRYYAVGWYSLYEPGAPRSASASVQVKF